MTKKAKITKLEGETIEDGETFEVTTHLFLTCCDCGLQHLIIVDKEGKPNATPLTLRFFRLDDVTEELRKLYGIKIKKKKVR